MTLALSLIVHIFAPLAVLAAKVDIVLTFTVEDGANIVMQKGEHSLGGKLSSAADYSWFGFKQHNSNTDIPSSDVVTDCTDATHCTATIRIEGGQGFDLQIGEDAGFEFNGNTNNIMQSDTLTLRLKGTGGGQEQPPQNNEPVSDKAYDLTFKLDNVMENYFELTAGTNAINVALKNTELTGTIKIVQTDNSAIAAAVSCESNKKECKLTAPANTIVKLSYDDGLAFEEDTGWSRDKINNNTEIKNTKTIFVTDQVFDGEAYLVWSCNNKICYHQITNIPTDNSIAYIDASTIANQNVNAGTENKFDTNASTKFFASSLKFLSYKSQIDAGTVNIEDLKGPKGIDYQPLRDEPTENNAFVSYGDRNFKAIVYNEDFRGIKLADLSELEYYPREWVDAFTRRESYDISSTTKENPVEILGVLLQSNVTIEALNINGFAIESIEALDVQEDAVTITKSGSKFNLKFNSNYYNKVVFKAKDAANHEYYFMINRRTIDPGFNKIGNGQDAILEAEVFYDSNDSYEDYNVLGKLQYKDGTTKVIKLTATTYGDDGLGNPVDVIEWNENEPPVGPSGKGIKRTKFIYKISDDEIKKVDKIYINVEKAGSTSEKYAGNFAGSGKGDVIDMANWKLQLYGEDRV